MPNTPKRLTKGVSSVGVDKALNMYGRMDPTKYITFFDDFVGTPKFATSGYLNDWISTTSQADGTITGLIGAAGGVVELNVQDSTDYVGLQTFNEGFALATGKQAWMGCRAKAVTDPTEVILRVGLADIETDIQPTRGIWFYVADAVVTMTFEVFDTASVATQTGIGTWVADTWAKWEVYFDGTDEFSVYLNDAFVGTTTTTAFPTGGLAPYIGFSSENDHATSNKTQIDYFYAIQER